MIARRYYQRSSTACQGRGAFNNTPVSGDIHIKKKKKIKAENEQGRAALYSYWQSRCQGWVSIREKESDDM